MIMHLDGRRVDVRVYIASKIAQAMREGRVAYAVSLAQQLKAI